MMRFSTKLKLWAGATAAAFTLGAVFGTAAGVMRRQWRMARKKRKLREKLKQMDADRASIEDQLRQLDSH